MKVLKKLISCVPAAIILLLIMKIKIASIFLLPLVCLSFCRAISGLLVDPRNIMEVPPVVRSDWFGFQTTIFVILSIAIIVLLIVTKEFLAIILAAVATLLFWKLLDLLVTILIITPVSMLIGIVFGD